MITSFAFILGVVPLALAVGAGAEMRRTLGLAVFSGMLGVPPRTPVLRAVARMNDMALKRRSGQRVLGSLDQRDGVCDDLVTPGP